MTSHLDPNEREELQKEIAKIVNDAVADLGMTVLWKDEDPVVTGVGDKNPPYYWTDKLIKATTKKVLEGLRVELPERKDMSRFETTGEDGGIDTTLFDSDEPASEQKNGETLAHLAQFASDTGFNVALDEVEAVLESLE